MAATRPRSASRSVTSWRAYLPPSGSSQGSWLAGPTVRVRGQRVDVSLLASTLAVLVNQAQNAFVTGIAPGRRGNAHPNIVPYETFATSDGEIVVAVGLRAAVAALLRRASGAGARRATRASRRMATASTARAELAAADRRAARGAVHGRVARGPDRCRHPVRPDHRRPHGVPVARGDRADPCSSRSSTPRSACCARPASRSSSSARRGPSARPRRSSASTPDEVLAELGIGGDEVGRLRAQGVV